VRETRRLTPLTVALDATPLLGVRTGIGRYVEHLVAELAALSGLRVRVAAFSVRRRAALRTVPAGVHVVHRPAPARLLHRAWLRGERPAAEWFTGRVDIVHGTNFVLPPPHRAAGVVTVHDLAFLHYPQLVADASLRYRELVPRAVRRAAVVLTPTRAVAGELAEAYGIPEDRLRVTPLGVDPSWYTARPARPPGVPVEYLLAVGTREPRKGLSVLLAGYRTLLAEVPDVPPLLLVGPPGWGPQLDTAGLRDRVITLGYVDGPTLRGLVAGASALAFPSRYEGFGLPPLEALAAGTPVVASDLPVLREVLGGHARFAAPGDADALAAALRDTLERPPSAECRDAARGHARRFTWHRCAALTDGAYREVVP
jgi:glycosyltransferase involved in cell wall biosynthesis